MPLVNQDFGRQVNDIFRQLDRALVDYSQKDRRRISRKAASKIAVAARRNTGFNDSPRAHFRKNGEQRIRYNPGNLRRSLGVVSLRRSKDAFVGPRFATKRATAYGGVGQPVDGYYAAILYGSALAFRRRVLEPALQRGRSAALKVLTDESNKAIRKRGVNRGLTIR